MAGGEKYPAGSLMLPVKNSQGEITGIQLISGDGVKSLMKGSKYSGCFIPVSDLPEEAPEKVAIAEGYGTAVSVSLLSDAWSLAALSKTNLKVAAEAVRERWPEAQIIIAGDNDFMDGKPNEGREVAIKAALAVKGWVCIPPGRAKADWDDYRRDFGIQQAREAFAGEMFNPGDTETRLPPRLQVDERISVCERTRNDGSESGQVQQIKICSPLKVTAITCDADGGNFGRLLEWEDSNGSRHEWAMPMTVLAGPVRICVRYCLKTDFISSALMALQGGC
ncbi:DNA primase [Klebsiella quasipneumoniae]|nr:DNA primase [Klebsiella quasipneumoniae]